MTQNSENGLKRREPMGWRVSVSIITVFGFIIALIVWAFFFAVTFNSYQNAASVVVAILALIAIMGATWAPWGMRQSGVDRS